MKISLAIKALRELGPQKLGLFALYKLGLKSGYFRWKTGDRRPGPETTYPPLSFPRLLLSLPDPSSILGMIGPEGLSQLQVEADDIVDGHVHLFGGQPVPLELAPPGDLAHWTVSKYQGDIKFIWEPARFGWAFTLGRAYHLAGDERYPEAFWRYFEIFQQSNPVNMGPNWESAQEVALRVIALTFASQIFTDSVHSTASRTAHLAQAIAEHATRIPPTLIYARAQNNNHLLSEAAGLITAALALPDHPETQSWLTLGQKWFTHGLKTQIAADGAYMQQSTNYHRLMLQLVLWIIAISEQKNSNLTSDDWHDPLRRATRWLLELCDRKSGRVPNLGPNDGAYILPLTGQPFHDYRPVLQAASRIFLGEDAFEAGSWDEMDLWITGKLLSANSKSQLSKTDQNAQFANHPTLHTPNSWAHLLAAKFSDRPGHADQLHLDLWWRGLNIAQDAGTYLYNADPPWDNALTHTAVHNTVMIDGCQQMTPVGRFLYLDRAQAEVFKREEAEDGTWEQIVARHDGYQKIGIIHQRAVTAFQNNRWVIEDQMLPSSSSLHHTPHSARLHWLLPDWEFELRNSESGIRIKSPHGWITLTIRLESSSFSLQLVRAGALLDGTGEISPTWGWVSPTYGVKQPALSFSVTVSEQLPINLVSEWGFPNE